MVGGACVVGDMHGRGCAWQGAYMAGGAHEGGHVWKRGHAWQGGMHGGGRGHGCHRMTDTYKNITLPQSSFAGGNKCNQPIIN